VSETISFIQSRWPPNTVIRIWKRVAVDPRRVGDRSRASGSVPRQSSDRNSALSLTNSRGPFSARRSADQRRHFDVDRLVVKRLGG
jgi:hypothetical protein